MFGVFSQVQGWVKSKGASDGTLIGNVGDSLKTNVTNRIKLDKTYIDPFARIITANPLLIGSYDHRLGKQPDYWDESITGSATSTANANSVSIDMACTTASGDKVIRQTYRNFEYKRGNSQVIFLSVEPDSAVSGNRRRYGYFDENNGAFFEITVDGLHVVRRSKASGSVVDTRIARANFNIDKLDGNGPSGVSIDLTMQNLFVIDFSWLGTNVIRFGIVVDGELIICHQINNSNVIALPWCQTGQLPIRLENENTGTAARSTNLAATCFAVFSNGATNGETRVRSVSSGTTAIAINATEKVVAGIRLKDTIRNVGAEGIAYDFLASSGTTNLIYKVLLRATLTSPTWASTSDVCDALTNNPAFTGGIILEQGHLSLASSARTRISIPAKTDMHLGYAINGTPDSLVMVVRTDSGNGNIFFDGYFREVV